jgi:hypothetical protein
MTPNEVIRLQTYLRKLLGNEKITIVAPKKKGAPVEILVGQEFIGVVHRDDDEGEISYALNISILEEDLPTVGAV